jgi:hypothetical protein
MGAGDASVARERKLESSAKTGSLHGSHKRFLSARHRVKQLVDSRHEPVNWIKRPIFLRVVYLFQIGTRTKIGFLQAHQNETPNRLPLQNLLNDFLPPFDAFIVQNIHGLPEIIKSRQQDAAIEEHPGKVPRAIIRGGEHRGIV